MILDIDIDNSDYLVDMNVGDDNENDDENEVDVNEFFIC